jgi:hypothetical protein
LFQGGARGGSSKQASAFHAAPDQDTDIATFLLPVPEAFPR